MEKNDNAFEKRMIKNACDKDSMGINEAKQIKKRNGKTMNEEGSIQMTQCTGTQIQFLTQSNLSTVTTKEIVRKANAKRVPKTTGKGET